MQNPFREANSEQSGDRQGRAAHTFLLLHPGAVGTQKIRLLQAAESSTSHLREETQPKQLLKNVVYNMQSNTVCYGLRTPICPHRFHKTLSDATWSPWPHRQRAPAHIKHHQPRWETWGSFTRAHLSLCRSLAQLLRFPREEKATLERELSPELPRSHQAQRQLQSSVLAQKGAASYL